MAKNYELGKVGQIVTVNATTNVFTFATNSAINIPVGNTAQRPATPANGMFRYNADYQKLENYANGAWANVGSVELVDSITNTSITYAPTANAVNYLNAIKANLSGASFSGTLQTSANLNVTGSLVANGTVGTAGQLLTSNGTTPYWSSSINVSGNVTSTNSYANVFFITGSNDYLTSTTSVDGWYYANQFSVSAQETEPRDLFFSSNGSIMYILGNAGDDITQYSLSTPWEVATATAGSTFSVSAQDITAAGLYFKPDGTAFYVLGNTSDTVYQYSLGTAWNITTASYASKSFSVTAQDTAPQGLAFSTDGTKMYVVGTTNDNVYQYNLGTAWDVSTAVFGSSFSVATYATAPEGISFDSTGTKFWITSPGFDRLVEYNLGTAWNLSTASFSQFSVISNLGTSLVLGGSGLYVNLTQGKAFISDYQNDAVFQLTTNVPSSKFIGTKLVVQPDALFQSDLIVDKNGRFNGEIRSIGTMAGGGFSTPGTSVFNGAVTMGTTTGAINIANAQTTGTLTVGGPAQTGTIQIGRSTANQVIAIANGATAAGSVKTLNIATESLAGSNTVIAIGPTASNSYLTINSNNVTFASNTAVILPIGTTAQRPTAATGMLRYNANLGLAEVYSGAYSSWGPLLTAYSDVRQQFTASNNQTTFTVSYLAGAVDVYYNGIKLRNGTEVDVSSGSSVVLATGAANGALVEVVGKGPSYVVSNTSQVVYQQFTASNNQTTFTVSGGYVPGMVDVFVEGIKLVNGTDVNVSSGNNIVLSTGIPNNSLVEVRGVFTPINPSTTAAVRQTFTANSTVNNNFTVTGGYIPGMVDVYYNGAKLVNGTDVNVSSGTTVALATNAAANAIVDVVGINYYTNAGGVTTPVRQSFTAGANQTTFTVTGGYTPGMIDVYQNGVKLVNGADVNVSGGSTVVLSTGAANNDTIDVVGFSAVSYQDSVKKSGDTMTGNLNVNGFIAANNIALEGGNISQVLTVNSANASGAYITFLTNGTPVFDIGSEKHIFNTSNTLNYAIASRSPYELSLGTAGNKRLIIDNNGYVTTPANPYFLARNNGSSQAAGLVTVEYTTEVHDNTNSYNPSIARFTAPVTGNYYFVAHTISRSVNQAMSLDLYKNGSQVSRAYCGIISSSEASCTVAATLLLFAGDYVTVVSTNGSYNNGYGFFTGHLIG